MAASTAYNFMGLSNGSRSSSVSHGTNSSFSNSLNQAIDLTAAEDDDDEDMDEVDTSAVHERHFKRPRIDSSGYPQPTPPLPPYSQTPVNQSARDRYRTQFVTNSSAFFPNRPLPGTPFPPPTSNSLPNLHHPRPQLAQPPQKAKSRRGHVRQVIDLTSSPSPPPVTAPHPIVPPHMPPHMAIHPHHPNMHPTIQQPMLHQTNLPPDLEPRTPICIGQLVITALILYPTPYLHILPKDPSQPSHLSIDFAPVRLRYDALARERSPPGVETIHIAIPPSKPEDGTDDRSYGENFGVVEQKVANIIGPMLGKGLIKVEAHVKRGPPNLPILPLYLLFFTPKGNITLVSQHLYSASLLLDHPEPPFDLTRLNILYSNPHNPPPGGYGRSGAFARQCVNKWALQTNSKTVEVQRNQVDEVFKSLKSGDELEETDPPGDINTKLYPHQKKALTFLLDRENEISGPARDPWSKKPQPIACRWQDGASSLWTARKDPSGRIISWMHAVTNREVFTEPKECKAALLADDMGLGKTITCVSLLAATLVAAREFGNELLDPLPRIPFSHSASESSLSATASQHEGKQKGKGKIEEKREIEEYNRACRLKVKSRGTLIVCPLSTIVNWEDQFKEHWAGEVTVVGGACGGYTIGAKKESAASIRVYVYHGNARNSDPNFLADFDAIITTFATLASEFSKQTRSADDDDASDGDGGLAEEVQNTTLDENGQVVLAAKKSKGKKRKKMGGTEQSSPLQMVHWFRVVLDEAHCIKETSTVGSRASCALTANRRLCLTGTPVQNKLDDVYALIKFLRLEPFDDKAIWTEYVGAPAKFGQPLGIARLQTLMKCITLRRTKETKAADGTNILNLPSRHESLEYLAFDEKEQRIYNDYFLESKEEFNQMSQKNEVMKNYVGILQKILRLRQICDHIELVKGKGVFADDDISDAPVNYEELVGEMMREGITVQRGSAIFNLLRESGTAQCVECGLELAPPLEDIKEEGLEDEVGGGGGGGKRSRKLKASQPTSRVPTRQSSPSVPRPVLTRCQHLFCMECFQSCICPGWPNVPPDLQRGCSACQVELTPQDAVELSLDTLDTVKRKIPTTVSSGGKREKRQKGQTSYMSTKIRALLQDLVQCSKSNPHSDNYDPEAVDIQVMDSEGHIVREDPVKTVVFSQWTSMLDKIEDALEMARIKYDRLDGTMKRDERTRAMDALKYDPKCEVLLVSLKAGGVGLNLTAAQRVYLMDPYWNPAVENQAVDRIHRLGQTRPVTIKKFIIENSIEDRLLEVQKRKTALANMTLGQPLSKAELMHRRVEELNVLFGQGAPQSSTE